MFLLRRPSPEAIERFLADSRNMRLSYEPIGLGDGVARDGLDGVTAVIGHGPADFAKARAALLAWKQFELGWADIFPRRAPVAVGTVVALLFRHLGFWSLNGCRVLYSEGAGDGATRFGFVYGTLTSHAIAGEELFEVFIDPKTDEVLYRIRATSSPRAPLARLGLPIVRALQHRFRRESVAAMRRAVAAADRTCDNRAP